MDVLVRGLTKMLEHGTIMSLIGGDGGMVDAGDLKSPDRKVVRVRLPLAPLLFRSAFRADPNNTDKSEAYY